jgi:tRNA(fMet)-specific endonuclease VapC
MRVAAFDAAAARQAFMIQRYLRQTGREIGRTDPMIAAQAIAADAVCVTDNVRHFLRIPGLTVENWLRTA